jgi:hypothetical protein
MSDDDSPELHDRVAEYRPLLDAAPPQADPQPTPEPWSHPWHDQLGLRYHQAIAAKIRAQPELRAVAVENIVRWTARNDYPASVLRALQQWRELLTSTPLEQLLAALTDPSERGHRIRQNTPFAGLLTAEERRHIRDEYEKATTH